MYPGEPMDELTAQYGDKAEDIAEEFEKAYPCRDLTDVLTINANRTNDLAIEKAQDGGQIWQAVFAYKLSLVLVVPTLGIPEEMYHLFSIMLIKFLI